MISYYDVDPQRCRGHYTTSVCPSTLFPWYSREDGGFFTLRRVAAAVNGCTEWGRRVFYVRGQRIEWEDRKHGWSRCGGGTRAISRSRSLQPSFLLSTLYQTAEWWAVPHRYASGVIDARGKKGNMQSSILRYILSSIALR